MAERKRTDLSYLKSMTMNDHVLMVEMIEIFLNKAPVALDDMKRLLKEKEWDQIAQQAHKIKPNLQYMGMQDSKKLVEKLEHQAKEKPDSEQMQEILQELEVHFKQAFGELKAKLKENF